MPLPEIEPIGIPVAGGELGAVRFGGKGSDRPVALAVHGITGTSRSWGPVARALGDRATLVAIDLRGRGASRSLPPPYGLGVHVDDLLTVLGALGIDRPLLIGHSLGAYIVARFAAEHPGRARALLLIDGGLPIPGSRGSDPQEYADQQLGPALARFAMTFPDHDAYRTWWRGHPSFSGGQVADEDIAFIADYELIGEPPELRPVIEPEAVRADGRDLISAGNDAERLTITTTLLCAPRSLLNDPANPMQPFEAAEAWAQADPGRREARLIPDVNHYTIVLGAPGAATVADRIAALAAG